MRDQIKKIVESSLAERLQGLEVSKGLLGGGAKKYEAMIEEITSSVEKSLKAAGFSILDASDEKLLQAALKERFAALATHNDLWDQKADKTISIKNKQEGGIEAAKRFGENVAMVFSSKRVAAAEESVDTSPATLDVAPATAAPRRPLPKGPPPKSVAISDKKDETPPIVMRDQIKKIVKSSLAERLQGLEVSKGLLGGGAKKYEAMIEEITSSVEKSLEEAGISSLDTSDEKLLQAALKERFANLATHNDLWDQKADKTISIKNKEEGGIDAAKRFGENVATVFSSKRVDAAEESAAISPATLDVAPATAATRRPLPNGLPPKSVAISDKKDETSSSIASAPSTENLGFFGGIIKFCFWILESIGLISSGAKEPVATSSASPTVTGTKPQVPTAPARSIKPLAKDDSFILAEPGAAPILFMNGKKIGVIRPNLPGGQYEFSNVTKVSIELPAGGFREVTLCNTNLPIIFTDDKGEIAMVGKLNSYRMDRGGQFAVDYVNPEKLATADRDIFVYDEDGRNYPVGQRAVEIYPSAIDHLGARLGEWQDKIDSTREPTITRESNPLQGKVDAVSTAVDHGSHLMSAYEAMHGHDIGPASGHLPASRATTTHEH